MFGTEKVPERTRITLLVIKKDKADGTKIPPSQRYKQTYIF